MYKIGVIGGMGPLATVNYYRKLVLSTPAKNDREHIDMVILNHASIPDRTDCIINGEKDKFLNAPSGYWCCIHSRRLTIA